KHRVQLHDIGVVLRELVGGPIAANDDVFWHGNTSLDGMFTGSGNTLPEIEPYAFLPSFAIDVPALNGHAKRRQCSPDISSISPLPLFQPPLRAFHISATRIASGPATTSTSMVPLRAHADRRNRG